MALSNWDTLAINESGSSCNGDFKSESGVCVSFYKNKLYVRDPKDCPSDQQDFYGSVVLEVMHGSIEYKDVRIEAVRGPQEGIFALISTGHTAISQKEQSSLNLMLGCGVYGYEESGSWIGVTENSIEFLKNFVISLDLWQSNNVHQSLADALDASNRFNQGDAYIANSIGADTPTSNPGEADQPLIEKLFSVKPTALT